MERTWYIKLFFIIIFNQIINAQEVNLNKNLDSLLFDFYSGLKNADSDKSLKLSRSIDSILIDKNELNIESLASYYSAKGYLYFYNNLNPELYLKKADSLNNLSPIADRDIKVYASFLLGEYYFDKKEDIKAKKAYSKLIDFDGIPEKFYEYKSKALNKTFFLERTLLNEKNKDSLGAKNVAIKIINFNKLINDTLNFEYGRSLEFLNKTKAAEAIFLNVVSIPETDARFNRYTKFQSLFWLKNYYYRRIGNYGVIDTLSANKLLRVSEELLSVVKNTDYLEPNNIYSVYGDIVVASIITKDQKKIDLYESKILSLLNNPDYPSLTQIDLGLFYYTIHKLKVYFEIGKDYEKAKFYAYKNAQLKKYLHGEFSVEYEKELFSYQNIMQLKMFDYGEAYKISLVREQIIKELFSEDSIEYLQLLYNQYGIRLNQMDHKKGLTLLEKAIKIREKINCKSLKLCDDVWFAFLNSLNNNGQYNRSLDLTKNLIYAENSASLFRISSIRRVSYFGLGNFIGVNLEFEWLLDKINNHSEILLTDKTVTTYYLEFLNDYQEHLRSTGRLDKALSFSKENLNKFKDDNNIYFRNQFVLNYLNILIQLNKCSEALNFIESNEVLKFDNLTTPRSKIADSNTLLNRLGRIYNCLGDNTKAIQAYKQIKKSEDNQLTFELVYMEMSRLYNLTGNKEESKKYLSLFEENFKNEYLNNISILHLLVDLYITNKQDLKALEFLIPLTEKIMDEICSKSFFSNSDNKTDKLLHDETISNILSLNNGEFYNSNLSANVQFISNLYKRRLDYYAQINSDIQKLKVLNEPDAIKLQNLENDFNINPTEIINEEIGQVKTKLIMSRLSNYEGLCAIDFNKILNNVNENELIIDIISYNNKKTSFNDFAVNFVSKNRNLSFGKIVFDDYYKLDEKQNINSYFFDLIDSNVLKAKNVNGDLIDTYYIIPSGKSNIINFSALSFSLEEKLNKKLKVHIINSLTDIPKIRNEKQKEIDNLILIGDIDYDKVSHLSSVVTTNQTRGIQLANSIENSGIPMWGYLPGTKVEIEQINQLGIKNKINVSVFREGEVTEPNLKKIIIDSKLTNVIHVATHAYFSPDELEFEKKNVYSNHKNPLLRSGLILSGANENWNNNSLIDSNNDGILTAEEISFMDLSGVELIVLSACDTRLGEISNLEGVNGLQRAFKLAGANKLIMSLWKVPDKETVEFFGYFYKFLLDQKLNITDSFRETQRIMKAKYSPYYWAGFVLLE